MNLRNRHKVWIPAFAGMTMLFFSSCVHRVAPPPVVKDLEIIDKAEEIDEDEEALEVKQDPGVKPSRRQDSRALVKVGLRIEVENMSVLCEGPIKVTETASGKIETWPAGSYMFRARDGKLVVNDKSKQVQMLKLVSATPGIFLQTNTNSYRGSFTVKAVQDSKVTMVNHLRVDEYLKGVLPREVVVSWHMECLKTQAVASRTYLKSHLGRHGAQGFDLCASVHCQVYGGTTKEHPQCNKAVDETRGEILTYLGKAVEAYFHSNCGGTTEKVNLVWGLIDKPFLPRKKCSFGTGDSRYNWRQSFSKREILELLKAKTSVRGSEIEAIRIKTASPSGRAQTMTVETDEGAYTLSGNEFRIALNPEKIRSTLWTDFSKSGDDYIFEGRGWGHGVGMCQWGAKGQAERGRSYRSILQFYYPHTTLAFWFSR